MLRLITVVTGIVLLAVAAVHAYRIFAPFDVVVAGQPIPVMYSWPAAILAAFLGLMMFMEARRR